MNIIVKKSLRVIGIVILVMGILGLIMSFVADQYGHPAHYSGAVTLIVFGISLYWAAGPKEKKENGEANKGEETPEVKEKKSFSEFVKFFVRTFKDYIEPLLGKVTDNIDWPLHLSSVPFFEKHKIFALMVGVVGGILWLLCLPFMAVSVLWAIVPCIIIGAFLYLFGVSEKATSTVFLCVVGLCFVFIILLLISY